MGGFRSLDPPFVFLRFQSPAFDPLSIDFFQRDNSIQRKFSGIRVRPSGQQSSEQPRKMRKVSGDEEMLRFAGDRINYPVRGVCRLKAACGRERRERVAPFPIRFSCLPRAQFSAVPDDIGLCAALRRFLRQRVGFHPAAIRQRPHRIYIGCDGIAMVNKKQHGSTCRA
jgi:hypothetical protein